MFDWTLSLSGQHYYFSGARAIPFSGQHPLVEQVND